ncbi:MAG: KEOPS complex kinase/ATPase Bud32 [Candidatus Diapherotrites archaeon]|nr:KEOPS complex kinase/ATPase Bud32 [Candidatus Diapherotrites archaeon]
MKTLAVTAEAILYKTNYLGKPAVLKKRVEKKYREPLLDQSLREKRIVIEAGIIQRAKKAGVRTPILYKVDKKNTELWMEFIEGKKLHEFLEKSRQETEWCKKVGTEIGKLHAGQIVHGDLTSSNILVQGKELAFIDFGLGSASTKLEDFAVDLLNFKKTLKAQYKNAELYWKSVEKGYVKGNKTKGLQVLKGLKEVELRVRYL